MLNSYWVKRDTNIKAVAHYKNILAELYSTKARVSSGADKKLNTSKALSLFKEADEIKNKNRNPAHSVLIDDAKKNPVLNFHSLDSVDKVLNTGTEARDKALSKLHELPEGLKIKQTENWRIIKRC